MAPEPDRSAARIVEATVRAPGRSTPLLSDVSLHLGAGERMLVLGPSGSGKSSLLQVLTGVIPFSQNLALEGAVHLGGVDATELPVIERSRRLGVVAQDPAAAVCLARVDQEVALPLENHGVDRSEISGRIDDALGLAGAGDLRERATGGLSGGEVQRVALAAALAARPAVLLLDEPTSMLDPAGVRAVRAAVDGVVERGESAVLMVEHRLDELAGARGPRGLPEHAVVLDGEGRMLAAGPTVQVLAENAARLHDAGCWLPLESELLAVVGHPGGLQAEPVREWLRERPTGEPQTAGTPQIDPPAAALGEPLLSARSLQVGHPSPGGRSARRRRPLAPPVLAGVDLDLRAGEVVALLGSNGSGKTSLLLTLAGLLPAQAGAVIGARPSMVFQYPELQFVGHRVRDEIAFGLTGSGSEVAQVVDRQLRLHRLEHVADRDPYRLSGGEKRRLSLAAMLAHVDRRVLLADEPTFGLDRRDTVATADVLRGEAAQGRAVLFSSHDLRFVATVADRVIVLADGRKAAEGETTAVLRDASVVQRAGLELPALVAWVLAEFDDVDAVRALRRLSAASAPQEPPAGSGGPRRATPSPAEVSR
ncbi:ABC transporter ATP-binding protein [Herbiconiux sp.]|uniref:ABC transporter ATP-binding protein n=1 Tax=Herbiconiux sp. TaxID=1871186 RepID=UPI0025BE535E|nr:ABC transporter ATP-binding protein [Herbiconiux sp.]